MFREHLNNTSMRNEVGSAVNAKPSFRRNSVICL